MNSNIRELRIDEVIWIIFIILSILNIIGDENEKYYYINNNDERDKLAKDIFIFTLVISLLLYLYTLYKRYNKMKNAKDNNLYICEYRLFGSILVVTATIIFIYCSIKETRASNPSIV